MSMKQRAIKLVTLTAALLFLGASVKADSIGSLSLADCGGGQSGCPAATYSFDITSTQATLTIHITGTVGSTNDYITAVNLGFTSSANTISNLSLPESPSSGWTAAAGSLSSGGTCGTNNGGFVCASASPLNSLVAVQDGTYTWGWSYNSLPSVFAPGDVHIGAEYGPNQGNYMGLIVSQTGATATPEPSSLMLLASSLLVLMGFSLKKKLLA